VVADIDGLPGQEIVAGTASLDLQAFDAGGAPANHSWPKLTGDWTVATPAIGGFGDGAHKVVVSLTRLGTISVYDTSAPVCSPSSWPRFHHDDANTGDYGADATLPGAPTDPQASTGTVTFTAPGDDLMCGTVAGYEVRLGGTWTKAALVGAPVGPGQRQAVVVPPGSHGALRIRAVDDAGNVGPTLKVKLA
jgi:hypothetical protein